MSDTSNFLQDIEKRLKGEKVVSLAWHPNRGDDYRYPPQKPHFSDDWEAVKFLFDYEYDIGYGGADCHAILLWTATRVIFVSEYDGSTDVQSLPFSYMNMTRDDVRFV